MIIPYNNHSPVVHEDVFVAPNAVLVGRLSVAKGASIWFGCVVRADINAISIGADSNIQDGCLLHVTHEHPLEIAQRVTAGHGAILHGCKIESDCLIAMGAIVLDGAQVGAGSVIAAGAVVAPNTVIPPGSLVMGVPGKVIRPVSDDERGRIEKGWRSYSGYKDIYREMGLPRTRHEDIEF